MFMIDFLMREMLDRDLERIDNLNKEVDYLKTIWHDDDAYNQRMKYLEQTYNETDFQYIVDKVSLYNSVDKIKKIWYNKRVMKKERT